MILKCDIWPTPNISATIITPVEVVVAVVIPISNRITPLTVITKVPTFISLTLVPIFLIGALGVLSDTPCLLIYRIRVLLIVIHICRRWWFRQIVHCIYLFSTLSEVLQYQTKVNSNLSHFFTNLICY